MQRNDTLISRDAKNKIRVIEISLTKCENSYVINRQSGILNMKMSQQPEIVISVGKSKRTLLEQANLEYNAIIRKQKDKGYKDIKDFGYTDLSQFNPNDVLPENTKTDQNGAQKPMCCKKYKEVKKEKLDTTRYKASAKLDGVRCSLFYKDGVVQTSSKGGKNYNVVIRHICNDMLVKNFFMHNPDLILDGEIYKHGWPLSKISGLCRKKERNDDMSKLKFYCFDIVDTDKTFNERLDVINDIKKKLRLTSKLVFVDHIDIIGYDNIIALHDKYVQDGYEGLVLREPDAKYKCNARDERMIKVKMFEDDEFEIIGISEGLRTEDMCFVLKTKEGCEFKAKPTGDRDLKDWYLKNIDNIIGKMGTVKYFGYTNTECRVPNLPVFKSIRYEDDM